MKKTARKNTEDRNRIQRAGDLGTLSKEPSLPVPAGDAKDLSSPEDQSGLREGAFGEKKAPIGSHPGAGDRPEDPASGEKEGKGKPQEKSRQKEAAEKRKDMSTYDLIAHYAFTLLSSFLIFLVNDLCGTSFTEKALVTLLPNERYSENCRGALEKLIADFVFRIREGWISKYFHLEIKSNPDGTISIRLGRYLLSDGKELINKDKNKFILPKGLLIEFRSNVKAEDSMELTICEGDEENEVLKMEIPVLHVDKLTLEELISRKLYILLPFFIFQVKDLKEAEEEDGRLEELKRQFSDARKRIEALEAENVLSSSEFSTICAMARQTVRYHCVNYPRVKEAFDMIFTDHVAEEGVFEILSRGLEKGREEGRKEGKDKERNSIIQFVKDAQRKGLSGDQIVDDLIHGRMPA